VTQNALKNAKVSQQFCPGVLGNGIELAKKGDGARNRRILGVVEFLPQLSDSLQLTQIRLRGEEASKFPKELNTLTGTAAWGPLGSVTTWRPLPYPVFDAKVRDGQT
jgi:hypothetical protein